MFHRSTFSTFFTKAIPNALLSLPILILCLLCTIAIAQGQSETDTVDPVTVNSETANSAAVNSAAANPANGDTPDIVGGRVADPGAWPWQVSLVRSYYSSARDGHFCGGTLIAADWVLTAAHCVYYKDESDVEVIVGRNQLSVEGGERITVTQILKHPDFDYSLTGPDLALIHLAKPSTQPVIAFDVDDSTRAEDRSLRAMVTGWGVTDGDNNVASDLLREVALPLVPLDTCNAYDAYDGYVGSAQICAGYKLSGKATCYGDSGGPLMIPTTPLSSTAASWVQVGIVSWGPYGCVDVDRYSVFTRVASYGDWITACLADPKSPICQIGGVPEADDTAAGATLIVSDGISLTSSFSRKEDTDWFKFEAVADQSYRIQTHGLSDSTDTILWLLAGDGVTALAFNDNIPDDDPYDYESSNDSLLDWRAPTTGIYYLQVDNRWTQGGGDATYTLQVEGIHQLFLPVVQN